MGLNTKHNGFNNAAAATNTTAALTTPAAACVTVRRPVGNSRPRVRGLSASTWRSTMRLNPIAANRAAAKATRTSATCRTDTGMRNEA